MRSMCETRSGIELRKGQFDSEGDLLGSSRDISLSVRASFEGESADLATEGGTRKMPEKTRAALLGRKLPVDMTALCVS